MKKQIIVRILCNGLIFIALLLVPNIAFTQEGSGENAAQKLVEKANKLTSSNKEFHDAVKKVTDAAKEEAKENPDDAEAVKKAASDKLDEEIRKAGGKPCKGELESLKKRWEEADLIAKTATITPDDDIKLPAKQTGKTRSNISLGGTMPLGDLTPEQVQPTDLQTALHAPSIFEQLMERLGSEFSIGDPSGQPDQNFEMGGTTQAMPGLRLGYRLGNRFELRAGGHYFQNQWSGTFPVMVFSNEQDPSMPPKTMQGSLSASSSGILAEADLAYFFTTGMIRPFVQAGIRGQFPTQNESAATLSGVALPLEITPLGSSYSPFGGAGLRVGFLKNGFVEANASYVKMPGGEYAPSVGLSLGWQFGATRKPDNRPELISINNGNCECNGANVAFKAKLLRGYINDDGNFKEINAGECPFDTRTNTSSCTATETVLPRHSVRFELTDLVIKCQDCKVGNCLPANTKVSVKTSGVAKFQVKKKDKNGKDVVEEKNEITLTAENGYDLGSLKVAEGSGPIRLEITIKYNCGSAESASATQCKKSNECKNEFVVIFNRE